MLKEEKSSRREKMPLAPDVALFVERKKNGIREKGLMYVCMCACVLSGDLFMSDKLER